MSESRDRIASSQLIRSCNGAIRRLFAEIRAKFALVRTCFASANAPRCLKDSWV